MKQSPKRTVTSQQARRNRRVFGRVLFLIITLLFVLFIARFSYIAIGKKMLKMSTYRRGLRNYIQIRKRLKPSGERFMMLRTSRLLKTPVPIHCTLCWITVSAVRKANRCTFRTRKRRPLFWRSTCRSVRNGR